MPLLITVLSLSIQVAAMQPDVSFFTGRWTTSNTSGPTFVTIESREGKVWVTIDRQRQPLEATVYLPSQLRSPEAQAIVSGSADRMFIIRRHEDGVVLDMFSTFSDRPPIYWSERFTRSK